jgi:hypothetical protein
VKEFRFAQEKLSMVLKASPVNRFVPEAGSVQGAEGNMVYGAEGIGSTNTENAEAPAFEVMRRRGLRLGQMEMCSRGQVVSILAAYLVSYDAELVIEYHRLSKSLAAAFAKSHINGKMLVGKKVMKTSKFTEL